MRCPNHPDLIATTACDLCQQQFCESCVVRMDNKYYCEGCKQRIMGAAAAVGGGGARGGPAPGPRYGGAPGGAYGGGGPGYGGGGGGGYEAPQQPKSKTGRNIFIACGCLLFLCVGTGALGAYGWSKMLPFAARQKCRENLTVVGTALKKHRDANNGALPWTSKAEGDDALIKLMKEQFGSEQSAREHLLCIGAVFKGPFSIDEKGGEKVSYDVIDPAKLRPGEDPLDPLIFDRTPDFHKGSRVVLFEDYSVRFLPEADFQKVLAGERVTLPEPIRADEQPSFD